MSRLIRESWTAPTGKAGQLLSALLDENVVLSDGRKPRGLRVILLAGKSAKVTITVGREEGGAQESRTFTLSNAGAWFSVAGWRHVKVTIDAVQGTDETIAYAWTSEPPPTPPRLILVEAATLAGTNVPRGAQHLQANIADPGFFFRSNPDGAGNLDIAAPLAIGVKVPVMGATYHATIANTFAWELDPV